MKTAEKNTMSYMELTFGSDWYAGIDENFLGNEPFDAIDAEYQNDEDWQEAANTETYWDGQVELDDKLFWIASEYETTMSNGICFLVEVGE